jgi:hypothetical protein
VRIAAGVAAPNFRFGSYARRRRLKVVSGSLVTGHLRYALNHQPLRLRLLASRTRLRLDHRHRSSFCGQAPVPALSNRFLEAPKALKPKALEGTVEADETYFLYSEKGSCKLKRPARKRGGKASKRGLSDEQVPVLIARDRNQATADEVLPDRSAASLSGALEPVIAKTAVLVSDCAAAYCAFASKAGLAHVAINLSQGERARGIYHIQNVNNYDSRLKSWIRRFNGVATKYLDSYLGWHRACDRNGGSLSASRTLTAAWGWAST